MRYSASMIQTPNELRLSRHQTIIGFLWVEFIEPSGNISEIMHVKIWSIFNSFGFIDVIWLQRSGLPMAQVACRWQDIIWTIIEISLIEFCGVNSKAISQEMLKTYMFDINLELTDLRLQRNFPENELASDSIDHWWINHWNVKVVVPICVLR